MKMRLNMLTSLFFAFVMIPIVPFVLAAPNTNPAGDLNMDFEEDDLDQNRDQIVNQLANGLGSKSNSIPGKQNQLANQGLQGVGNARTAAGLGQTPLSNQRVAGARTGMSYGNQQDLGGQRIAAPNARGRQAAGGLVQPGLAQQGVGGLAQPDVNNFRANGRNFQQPMSALTNASNLGGNIAGGNRLNPRLPPSAQMDINDDERNELDEFKSMSQSLALPTIVGAGAQEIPQAVANQVTQQLQNTSQLLAKYHPELADALNTLGFTINNPQLMQKLNYAFKEGFDGIKDVTDLSIGSFFDITQSVLGLMTRMGGDGIETAADTIGAFTRPGKRMMSFAGDTAIRSTQNMPFLGTAVQGGFSLGNDLVDSANTIGHTELKKFGRNVRNRGQQSFANGDMNNGNRFQRRLQRRQPYNQMQNNSWMNPTNQEIPMLA